MTFLWVENIFCDKIEAISVNISQGNGQSMSLKETSNNVCEHYDKLLILIINLESFIEKFDNQCVYFNLLPTLQCDHCLLMIDTHNLDATKGGYMDFEFSNVIFS